MTLEDGSEAPQPRDFVSMKTALSLAGRALEAGELPIAAVLVLDEHVVAEAYNRVRGDGDLLAHAELLTLRLAISELKKMKIDIRRRLVLYSTLEPCLMCFGAVMALNVGKVCFALESPGDGVLSIIRQWQEKSNQLPNYRVPEILPRVLSDESARLLREFGKRNPSSRFSLWTSQLSRNPDV